jgi:hypothetical protein
MKLLNGLIIELGVATKYICSAYLQRDPVAIKFLSNFVIRQRSITIYK